VSDEQPAPARSMHPAARVASADVTRRCMAGSSWSGCVATDSLLRAGGA
jgi:hypothetical protein